MTTSRPALGSTCRLLSTAHHLSGRTTTRITVRTSTTHSRNGRIHVLQQAQRIQQQQQRQQQQQQQRHKLQSSLAINADLGVSSSSATANTANTTTKPSFSHFLQQSLRLRQQQQLQHKNGILSSQSSTSISSLSWHQVRSLFLSAAIPMVGFGIMDQAIMVCAGSYIDQTLGVQLGLATMSAAAAGQVISDSCGVLFGGTLERLLLIQPPNLSTAQQALPSVSRIKLFGAFVGVIVGCTIGAIPLLMLPREEEEEMKNMTRDLQRLSSFVDNVMTSPNERWHAYSSRCTIHVSVDRAMELSTKFSSNSCGGNTTVVSMKDSSSSSRSIQECIDCGDVILSDDHSTMFVPVMVYPNNNRRQNNNNSSGNNDGVNNDTEQQQQQQLAVVAAVMEIDVHSSSNNNAATTTSSHWFNAEDMNNAKNLARHVGYLL